MITYADGDSERDTNNDLRSDLQRRSTDDHDDHTTDDYTDDQTDLDENFNPDDEGHYDVIDDEGDETTDDHDEETTDDDMTEAPDLLRCGRGDVDPEEVLRIDHEVARRLAMRQRRAANQGMNEITTIPVYFHLIMNDRGDGLISNARINKQISVLNQAFSGSTRLNNKPEGETRFRFDLRDIYTHTNTSWHRNCEYDAFQILSSVRVGDSTSLNIVSCVNLGEKLGYGSFPAYYEYDPMEDGIVIKSSAVAFVNGGGRYGKGDTAVHEVGHWLGLHHTFNGVTKNNNGRILGCDGDGDFVDDTPAHYKNFACVRSNTCPGGGSDPIHNFMNYTDDSCIRSFSDGQIQRMRDQWSAFRQLNEPGPNPHDHQSERPIGKITRVKRDHVKGFAFDLDLGVGPARVRVFVDNVEVAEGVANLQMAKAPKGHREVGKFHGFHLNIPRMSRGVHLVKVLIEDYDATGQVIRIDGTVLGPRRVRYQRR